MSIDVSELHWDPMDLRAAQILVIALVVGPLMFLGVVVVLQTVQPPREIPPEADQLQLVLMLSAVNAFMAPSCWVMAAALFRVRSKALRSLSSEDPERLASRILAEYRPVLIVSLALCEGAALFGIVCVFLAGSFGVLAENPLLWVNTSTTLGLIAAASAVFPTEFRLRSLVETRC